MINKQLFDCTKLLARQLAWQLHHHQTKIVFAESCTAGLVSAILAQVPGISNWLCGSAVTYQESVKHDWLRIDTIALREHTAVSRQVTDMMAEEVLRMTSAAGISVAITGHLETSGCPDAPLAYVSLAHRNNATICICPAVRFKLNCRSRINRQWEAARNALTVAVEHFRFPPQETSTTFAWQRVMNDPSLLRWNHWM
jgi:PncC family amidohydrolase